MSDKMYQYEYELMCFILKKTVPIFLWTWMECFWRNNEWVRIYFLKSNSKYSNAMYVNWSSQYTLNNLYISLYAYMYSVFRLDMFCKKSNWRINKALTKTYIDAWCFKIHNWSQFYYKKIKTYFSNCRARHTGIQTKNAALIGFI